MSNQDFLIVVIGTLLAIFVFVVFSLWGRKYGAEVIENWAKTGGFQLVSTRRLTLVPLWLPLDSRKFQFFRVTVRDNAGVERKALLRLESDCTKPEILDVAWDDQNTP